MNLSIVGTKGAGIGTEVGRLVKDFNLLRFSAGDIVADKVITRLVKGGKAQNHLRRFSGNDFEGAVDIQW